MIIQELLALREAKSALSTQWLQQLVDFKEMDFKILASKLKSGNDYYIVSKLNDAEDENKYLVNILSVTDDGGAVDDLSGMPHDTFKTLAAAKKSLNESTEATPMYRISWKGYPGNPKPEMHDISYFDDDMGFDSFDVKEIKALAVGEEYKTGGPSDHVVIVRKK